MPQLPHFILDGTVPRAVAPQVWAQWFATADRRVAVTELTPALTVVTLFTGVPLRREGPPLVFETLVIDPHGTPADGDTLVQTYSTWQEAAHGHAAICAQVRARLAAPPQEGTP